MARDSEPSELPDSLPEAVVPTDKHAQMRETRSSTGSHRSATRNSWLQSPFAVAYSIKSLLRPKRVISTPDPGDFSHQAAYPGELSGSHVAAPAGQNPADGTLSLPSERADGASLTLERHQVGRELVRSLKMLCDSTGAVPGKMKCDGVPRMDLRSLRLKMGKPRKEKGVIFAVKYATHPKHEGIVTLLDANVSHFSFPLSSVPPQRPTDEDTEEFIENILKFPPAGPIAYYVGDPLTNCLDEIIETDDELRRLRDEEDTVMKGVNTTYWLLGAAGSGTAAHCEDANLRSCNITIEGYKKWYLVEPESTETFEAWARSIDGPGSERDDQWVRRRNILPTREILVKYGIKFSEFVTGPGEMITTAPRQYHWVYNITDSLSLAINFAFDGELQQGLESAESLPLTKDSPMWGLRQKHMRTKTPVPAREDGGQPSPPRRGGTDSDAGEPARHSSTEPQAPTIQDVASSGPSNRKRTRPHREAAKAVHAGAYHAPPPAKRQRRGKGGGGGNTAVGEQMQQEKASSSTGPGPLHQTPSVDDGRCDTEGLPSSDGPVRRVLLALRGKGAEDNHSGILWAWEHGDCHPRNLVSEYLSSKNRPQQPNGHIGTFIRKSSHRSQLDHLLANWGMLLVYQVLYNKFGHTKRFDDYHQLQLPTLLGDSKVGLSDARLWYNTGSKFDSISPGTLEGLAIFCLLPTNRVGLKDSEPFNSGTQVDFHKIKSEADMKQLRTLYREHGHTYRLVKQTAELIRSIVTSTAIP